MEALSNYKILKIFGPSAGFLALHVIFCVCFVERVFLSRIIYNILTVSVGFYKILFHDITGYENVFPLGVVFGFWEKMVLEIHGGLRSEILWCFLESG